jgi:hypothetical protein
MNTEYAFDFERSCILRETMGKRLTCGQLQYEFGLSNARLVISEIVGREYQVGK